jgi:multidrug resistance efflux pump
MENYEAQLKYAQAVIDKLVAKLSEANVQVVKAEVDFEAALAEVNRLREENQALTLQLAASAPAGDEVVTPAE